MMWLEALRQMLVAGMATITFSILFHVPARSYLAGAFTGAVGWLVSWLMVGAGQSTVVASLVAVLPLTLLCRIFAVWLKTPITVFLFSGIFPLVPGAALYYTAYYFIRGDTALFTQKGIEALKIAVAMALGIAFVLSLPRLRRSEKDGRQ